MKKNDKKPSTIPEEYQEYIDIYKGDEKDTFIFELIPKSNSSQEDEKFEDDVILEDDLDNEFATINNINLELKILRKGKLNKAVKNLIE